MNISDLIKTLEEIEKEHGDLPVNVKGDYNNWEDAESVDVAYHEAEKFVKIGV